MNNGPCYYLMKNKIILRLEAPLKSQVPKVIQNNLIDTKNIQCLNQDQANYRVAIFRDEILEYDDFIEKMKVAGPTSSLC